MVTINPMFPNTMQLAPVTPPAVVYDYPPTRDAGRWFKGLVGITVEPIPSAAKDVYSTCKQLSDGSYNCPSTEMQSDIQALDWVVSKDYGISQKAASESGRLKGYLSQAQAAESLALTQTQLQEQQAKAEIAKTAVEEKYPILTQFGSLLTSKWTWIIGGTIAAVILGFVIYSKTKPKPKALPALPAVKKEEPKSAVEVKL